MTDRSVAEILEELLAWTKFASNEALLETLRSTLADREEFLAYEASDGTRTQAQVAEAAGISQPTVSRMWSRWRRLGLLRVVDGRGHHLASAAELGLTPPKR
jgi:CRP-like cAMP-binding protein